MPGLFFLALAGGFITVLSPCVLPVLPILLGIGGGKSPRRPLMIIAGFVASFSALGAAFATAGTLLGIGNAAFRLVAVALLILFGAALIFEGLYERAAARFQAFLSRLGARLSGGAALKTDAASGFVLGASLAIVWTPCAGPILGTILTLASRTMDYATTVLLMFAYSLGASGPMLAIAYGGGAIRRWIAGLGAWQRVFNVVFGVLVIATAILIFTGEDVALEARLLDFGRSSNNTAIAPVPSTLPVLADRMPEFANVTAWLNSEPLTPVTLKG